MERLNLTGIGHKHPAGSHTKGASLRMHAEQIGRQPAEPICLRAELVDESQRVRANRCPLRWCEIAARRGVLGQTLGLLGKRCLGGIFWQTM